MKKTSKMLMAAVCMAVASGFSSCSSEDSLESNITDAANTRTVTFTGSIADITDSNGSGPATRMGIDSWNKRNFQWEKGDFITVWANSGDTWTATASDQLKATPTNVSEASFTVSNLPKADAYYVTYNSEASHGSPASYLKVSLTPATHGTPIADNSSAISGSSNLPILAQCKAAKSTSGAADNDMVFTLEHKLAYVYVKTFQLDGAAAAYGSMTGCDGVSMNCETGVLTNNTTSTLSDTETHISADNYNKAKISEGNIYAVAPGAPMLLNIGYTKGVVSIGSDKLSAGSFNTVEKNYSSQDFMLANNPSYYMWDAEEAYPLGSTPASGSKSYYNTTTTANASHSCKNCPTLDEIRMICSYHVYWQDRSSDVTAGTYAPVTINGTAVTKGIWIIRSAYINPAKTITVDAPTNVAYTTFPTDLATLTKTYRFLPAAGNITSGSYGLIGSNGYYWSSTVSSSTSYGYNLYFNSSTAGISSGSGRTNGFLPWAL